jgi:hypothetical protein
MFWFLVCVSTGAVPVIGYTVALVYLRLRQRTALILIHPKNIGSDRDETRWILRALALKRREKWGASRLSAELDKSDCYRERLRTCIRKLRAYRIVLIEEPAKMESSVNLLREITPKWRHRLTERLDVPSRFGRSTPKDGTWIELAEFLANLGVRKIVIGGCFVGMYRDKLIEPEEMYFCINEAVLELRKSRLFESVDFVPEYSLVETRYEIPRKGIARMNTPKHLKRRRK